MRNFVPCLRSRLLVRVAAIALVSGATAACSSDSNRFGESPFSNPFSSASAERQPSRGDGYATGSIQAAPTTRVQRSPLGAPSAAQSKPMRGFEGDGGGSYRTSSLEPRSTGSLAAPRSSVYQPTAVSKSGWSAEGGSTITLGRGETVTTAAARYGVPASAIMQANGLSSASGVGEGTRLVIPVYSANGSAMASSAPMSRPVQPRAQAMATAPVAAAPKTKMQFTPGAQPAGMAVAKPMAPKPLAAAKPVQSEQAFAAQPARPSTEANDSVKTAALKADPAPAADTGPSFRWPARGRVISAYGSKTSGSSNDGVNIAVPEGTDIKASDDGVVAYSGSELKGFGNLVLIRHSNGWVTAYAHNSALNVKRGETVRRGQIIAKSGATGSVSSPQLHFEVRKGAQTVDPMKHLPDV